MRVLREWPNTEVGKVLRTMLAGPVGFAAGCVSAAQQLISFGRWKRTLHVYGWDEDPSLRWANLDSGELDNPNARETEGLLDRSRTPVALQRALPQTKCDDRDQRAVCACRPRRS